MRARWRLWGGLIPGPRLAALAALGILPLLLIAYAPARQVFLFYNLGLLALAAADLLLDPRPRRLTAVRTVERIMAVGRSYTVQLEVSAAGGRPLRLQLLDDGPPQAGAPEQPLTVLLRPPAVAAATYRISPRARGDLTLGPLHGRYRSPLGLWLWRVRWELTDPVRVYPSLPLKTGMELLLRSRMQQEGARRARVHGLGTDLESLREYQPGDSYRTINWPAVARRGRLIVNQYQVDRSQQVMILLDCGRSMTPHAVGQPLLEHALQAGLLLAWVAGSRGDRVGLLRFSDTVEGYVAPAQGRAAMQGLLGATYDARARMVQPDYDGALAYLQARQRRRSLLVLLTSIAEPAVGEELVKQVGALTRRHLVMVVSQQDPELDRMARCLPESSAQAYAKAAAQEVLAARAETTALLRRAGAVVVDAPPERIPAAVANRYLELKEQGRL